MDTEMEMGMLVNSPTRLVACMEKQTEVDAKKDKYYKDMDARLSNLEEEELLHYEPLKGWDPSSYETWSAAIWDLPASPCPSPFILTSNPPPRTPSPRPSASIPYSSLVSKQCLVLLNNGIHPTVIFDDLHKASTKVVDVMTALAVPVELSDRDSLVKSASTSLNSKVVSQYSTLLSPLAFDVVLSVVDPVNPNLIDLRDVEIAKKLGGTVDDIELVKGLVFDKKVNHSSGGSTRVKNAKIAVIQFQISPPKTDIEQSIVVSDYTQMERILKEGRNHLLCMIKKIKGTGCNVLLIQKSILRDAVIDLSLHYMSKAKILVIRDLSVSAALLLRLPP